MCVLDLNTSEEYNLINKVLQFVNETDIQFESHCNITTTEAIPKREKKELQEFSNDMKTVTSRIIPANVSLGTLIFYIMSCWILKGWNFRG